MATRWGRRPVDEWWHQAFGRDAVLWSAPHLAFVGTISLATSVTFIGSGGAGSIGRLSA